MEEAAGMQSQAGEEELPGEEVPVEALAIHEPEDIQYTEEEWQ